MDLRALLPLLAQVGIVFVLMWAGTRIWLNRQRARNAPLRSEIQADVRLATGLDRASILLKNGFGGTWWGSLQGPRRLTVGTDAFIFSAPNALKEYVFKGCECSIAISQAPSRFVNRDWIVITGEVGDRLVQLAISHDNLLEVWQALAETGAVVASTEVPAGHLNRPSGRPVRSGRYSLQRLAVPVVIVLIAEAAACLGAIALPRLSGLCNVGFFVAMVMFVVWFYRARVNADGHGWPQRQSPGLAIWSWFFPVVNLWYPFQVMADIRRAGLPAQARASPAIMPGIWWTCWLAFFTLSSFLLGSGPGSPAHPARYAGWPVKITGMLAAIMTALLVQKVSSGPLGRKTELSDP